MGRIRRPRARRQGAFAAGVCPLPGRARRQGATNRPAHPNGGRALAAWRRARPGTVLRPGGHDGEGSARWGGHKKDDASTVPKQSRA